jgi:pimeloyl-ACP methyl ester carboxylesterase
MSMGHDVRLTHREQGQGEPLLLIMGLGADGSAWDPHVAEWSKRFRCLAVDNRGAGRSPAPPGPYSTAEMADDYARLARRLNLEGLRVVGISMGGAIAQELALRHPDLVSKLVLVATWARLTPYPREVFAHLARIRASVPPDVFTRTLQLWIWSPAWFDAHLDELVAEQEAADGAMPQPAFDAQAAACITHDTSARLAQIRVPTLVTAGDRDVFVPPALSNELADGIPRAELEVFSGWAHTHHWEDLDRFNALVREWL